MSPERTQLYSRTRFRPSRHSASEPVAVSVNLSEAASEICEEFRPGKERKFSDDEVKTKIEELRLLYEKTAEGIRKYEESAT